MYVKVWHTETKHEKNKNMGKVQIHGKTVGHKTYRLADTCSKESECANPQTGLRKCRGIPRGRSNVPPPPDRISAKKKHRHLRIYSPPSN